MKKLHVPWTDITLGMDGRLAAWPGDIPFSLRREQSIASGDAANVTSLSLSSHFGTHMDAPAHYQDGGVSIDQAPLDLLVGVAYLLDVRRYGHILGPDALRSLPQEAVRVLLRTCNEDAPAGYQEGYAGLNADAAEYLVKRGIRLIVINAPSFAASRWQEEAHGLFLQDGSRFILENAYLSGLREGWYDLICLPIKVVGAEGAPARALVRKRGEEDEG